MKESDLSLLVEISHLILIVVYSSYSAYSAYSTYSRYTEREIQVVIAAGSHLFPFRTEKLSPLAPMVLQCNAGE